MTVYEGLYLAASYLLGSVPFGLILGKFMGSVDVRTVGSGNIGATNVLRAAGKKAAVLTLLADGLKGYVTAALAGHLFTGEWVPVLAAIAAVVGHNYPVYLSFRGGKGVATSFGAVLAVSPWTGAACLLAWLAAALFWRYSSLAALVAFALNPLITFALFSEDRPRGVLSVALFAMIYYRHRENIRRLLAGTEPKIGSKGTA